jgi:hypothetical protein
MYSLTGRLLHVNDHEAAADGSGKVFGHGQRFARGR